MPKLGKYREFFDIDEKYFPCIDDSAIEAGASWNDTYPHETFIDLLKNVERMLGGSTRRSIWIHGAYGTGKSKCAYALKKILEVPEEELIEYWNSYEPLKENNDLLQKILGHKARNIVTAYRYASGGITTPRDLFFAIQESVKKSLVDAKVGYLGENTLKESVIDWLEDDAHKNFFNELLKKPEWMSMFTQSSADEVVNYLKKSTDVKSLMDNIFSLADKEGISAMNLDADKLKDWLKDVIEKNDIKIVLVWDEFSGFFKQNKNSLDEFQKIVALCESTPFYFIVVTHQTDYIINPEDQSWSVVRQRFNFSQITLPDNIAFNLIGHAFNVKPAAKDTWDVCASDLNARLDASRKAVMSAARISNPKVIKDIMPIHPMAALVLKNIATAFKSNQRSMFDFIKTPDSDDVKAFQWFIESTGPLDDYPLLTIDMLWDFFYEKGRENLSSDIRMILDAYPQQQNLRDDEQRVLKTVLIMQAIDKRLGGAIDVIKPTDQNISYAFEGINNLDVDCKNIAKGLNQKGVLVLNPLGNNKFAYGAAVLAGDQAKIDEHKKTIRSASTTSKLVADGKLDTVLSLSPAVRLRFEETTGSGSIIPVTTADFTRIINSIKDRKSNWHFNAVIGFAKNDEEAASLRKMIKEAALNDEYKDIVFIDATSTPLGEEDFDAYVNFSAMSLYYQSNNNQSSRENASKANQVLSSTWRNRIYTGTFVIYYDNCREGEKVVGGTAVGNVLQSIVLTKHSMILDFNRGVNENQMKLTTSRPIAKCGIIQDTNRGGVVAGAEKWVLANVWKVDNYWTNPDTNAQNISEIKRNVESLIDESFSKEGQISIGEIYDFLEVKYGFAPCNLSAFITGFLLKEYSTDPYRYSDSTGSHEPMTPDKLSEMIGNYIGKSPAPTYIVKMTPEEKSFYEVTEKAWGIPENSCASVPQAANMIRAKMKALGLPIWSLSEVDELGVYDIVAKYIELVQKEGSEAHKIAITIGTAAMNRGSLGDSLQKFITVENCQSGMKEFVRTFEGGKLQTLADEINANDGLLRDISNLFSVEYSNLWNSDTGRDQIKVLITDYTFVKDTNYVLGSNACSKKEAFAKWTEQLNFVMCSYEALQIKYPNLVKSIDFLLKVSKNEEILPDQMREYVAEFSKEKNNLKSYLSDEITVFKEIYTDYLSDIDDEDLSKLKTALTGVFVKTRTESNQIIKRAAEEFRKNQARTKLNNLWREKTGSKSPLDWSSKNRTPILKMVKKDEFEAAKKAFDTINRSNATDVEINKALEYVENTKLFEDLNNTEKIDSAFRLLLGRYKGILTDLELVRNELEKLPIDPYEWDSNPNIFQKINQLAKAEYDAGGSDKAIAMIDKKPVEEVKKYLIQQIKDNMNLGIEILNGGE